MDIICPLQKIAYIWTKIVLMSVNKQKPITFGEQLRALREKKKLPLREVALRVDIDPSLLAKIERNERQPTKELIGRIATYFKVDEKKLRNEFLSDQIAYKVLDDEVDIGILKVAEAKVAYLKIKRKG